jgi:polysaccharide biosynthesis protein PslH
MKILLICSKFPFPFKDGGAIATYTMARGLANCNNQVSILSFNTRKHYIARNSIPEKEFKDIEFELVDIDTSINYFDALLNLIFSGKPYILKRFGSTRFNEKLKSYIEENQFDIIQVEGLYMMQYRNSIRSNSKSILAYRPHNLEHKIWQLLSENATNWLRKKYYKNLSKRIYRFEKMVLNTYDLILPISPFDSAFYEKAGNTKKIAVVPAGLDKSNYPEQITRIRKHKLFYVGSLEWIPNQEGIIWFIKNCWDKLREEFPTLELHIAGRNTPRRLMSDYKLPGIFWAGEVEHIQDFIKDKTIMIVPLFSGSGMRVKIVEAFFSYKAVVATQIAVEGTGGADNCELLVADGNIEFVSKIKRLLRNEKLFDRLISDAYKFACLNFDNQNISSDLSDLFNQMVNSK